MTQPLHLSEQAWKDAEALVDRIEAASRTSRSPQPFCDDLVTGLRFVCGASTTSISVHDEGHQTVLARSGVALHPPSTEYDGDDRTNRDRIVSDHALNETVFLRLQMTFDRSVSLATEEHLQDLTQVLLALAATVYLRHENIALRQRIANQSDHDRFISQLNQGITLEESFASIAAAIASQTSADRVSVLRVRRNRVRLVATSSQPRVDRRGGFARSLEAVADVASEQGDFSWSRDSPVDSDSILSDAIEVYAAQTQSHALQCRSVLDESSDRIAVVCLEKLRSIDESNNSHTDETISVDWDRIGPPIDAAIRLAVRRDEITSGRLIRQITSDPKRSTLITAAIAATSLFIACFPTTLRVPAEGVVIASERNRMFAPEDGIVAEVFVKDQQKVRRDQPLLRITSSKLDQSRAEIEGDLATVRAQLDGLLATRSVASSSSQRTGAGSVSADERVLRTEIEGLEKQLEIVQRQQDALAIHSPIDGYIDGWDLQRSLAGRPVARGQSLMDVIAPDSGYRVELDLPDDQSLYVREHAGADPIRVAVRLRSDPTVTYQGVVRRVAETAQTSVKGESVVRITVEFEERPSGPLRHGATVVAQIDGPHRSIGFVWFRRIIQWSREQVWL